MYKVKVTYETGDSFDSWTETEIIEYDWNDIEVLKENMIAIQQHNRMSGELKYKRANKEFFSKYKKNDWFVDHIDKYGNVYAERCIFLKMDDGTKVQYSCPWIGCFELLKKIEAIIDLPSLET